MKDLLSAERKKQILRFAQDDNLCGFLCGLCGEPALPYLSTA
jgi:hypothetical protein